MTVGFQMRAPWYTRERDELEISDAEALRPVIQKYDSTEFSKEITDDPAVSLAFEKDDQWSYPVPVKPGAGVKGRKRLATSRLVYSTLRKLYQPSHSRFYAVVVEVFCDSAGLPRAGSHDEIEVSCVMRRQHTSIANVPQGVVRSLAKSLLHELAAEQSITPDATPDLDLDDVWWTRMAERGEFELENAQLLADIGAKTAEQAWTTVDGVSRWEDLDEPLQVAPGEEQLPMWRIPPREGDCEAARTRSLWFGLVPTYAADHWTDEDGQLHTKLDDREIYQLRCVVTVPPEPGHESCPPRVYVSAATRAFRLAAAMDPDGTKNRTVSVTTPDLRRLAARAGEPPGPGGLRIVTPPQSRFSPINFKSIPGANLGSMTGGLPICTFAFELFFMVAFFLFLLFLPIVVLAFQLWFMLALRFCIPPTLSFGVVADFFAAGHLLTELTVPGAFPAENAALDELMGVPNAAVAMTTPGSKFLAEPDLAENLVLAMHPGDAQQTPPPRDLLERPPDPLCPTS